MRGIHRGSVNFPHKWSVTRKMFPFDDVIMINFFIINSQCLFIPISRPQCVIFHGICTRHFLVISSVGNVWGALSTRPSITTVLIKYSLYWTNFTPKSYIISEHYCVLIKISPKCVSKGPIDNKKALDRRIGGKLIISEPIIGPV